MRLLRTIGHDCPLCIDGFQPAGRYPVLGLVYMSCVHSVPCGNCGGVALFPTTCSCIDHLQTDLLNRGYIARFCIECGGVLNVGEYRP